MECSRFSFFEKCKQHSVLKVKLQIFLREKEIIDDYMDIHYRRKQLTIIISTLQHHIYIYNALVHFNDPDHFNS